VFPRTTGGVIDPRSPSTVASDVTIGFLLQLDRSARLVAQHAVDTTFSGLEEVIDRLSKAVFEAIVNNPYEAEVRPSNNACSSIGSCGWLRARPTRKSARSHP
jgi:hypothetical protein